MNNRQPLVPQDDNQIKFITKDSSESSQSLHSQQRLDMTEQWLEHSRSVVRSGLNLAIEIVIAVGTLTVVITTVSCH